jgi:hypothetical protein
VKLDITLMLPLSFSFYNHASYSHTYTHIYKHTDSHLNNHQSHATASHGLRG